MSDNIIKTQSIPKGDEDIYLVQQKNEAGKNILVEVIGKKPEISDDEKKEIIKNKIFDLQYKLITEGLSDEEKEMLQLLG